LKLEIVFQTQVRLTAPAVVAFAHAEQSPQTCPPVWPLGKGEVIATLTVAFPLATPLADEVTKVDRPSICGTCAMTVMHVNG
jgi:hypothetical protein